MTFLPEPWEFLAFGAALATTAVLVGWLVPGGMKLAIYVGCGALVMFMFAGIAHEYEARGELKVQLAWDEAIEAQKVKEAAAAKRADEDQAAKEAKRAKDYAALRTRNKALEEKLATACVDPALIAGMRDSVRTANSEGPREPEKDPAAAAGTPDGNQVNDWFAEVTRLYRACREQVIGWVKWDDERVSN